MNLSIAFLYQSIWSWEPETGPRIACSLIALIEVHLILVAFQYSIFPYFNARISAAEACVRILRICLPFIAFPNPFYFGSFRGFGFSLPFVSFPHRIFFDVQALIWFHQPAS